MIKAVLMMQKGVMPVQANFNKLNSRISPLNLDHMDIPLKTKCWKASAVCVNNYGAAGSNAAMIVCKTPGTQVPQENHAKVATSLRKHPLLLSAHSDSSLRAYCAALHDFLARRDKAEQGTSVPADMAFELAHRGNNTLSHSVATSVSSLAELETKLIDLSKSEKTEMRVDSPNRPNVLCFGGQTKAWIGLNEELYQSILILRMHLDRCESMCRSLGVEGFYPEIFRKSPTEDIVLLQCMLFSLQYACAKSWIDCGLKVDVVVGHSFGQLTALCVSGSISLQQALQLISGRANLIKDLWGPERGTMLSIESDYETVSKVLSLTNESGGYHVEVACFNSPSTHILVGSKASIEALECKMGEFITSSGEAKIRRLDVTHGFHSHFVDPILSGLAELTSSIDFHEPHIQVEACSRDRSWNQIDAEAVTRHSREPVYFSEAINRIAEEKGLCNWIEAGTDSGITTMARRTLDISVQAKHTFQPISLTSENGMDSLADAIVGLWQSGVKVQFWPYHRLQRHEYKKVSLPPYQFDKHRHWMEYKERAAVKPREDQDWTRTPDLLSFVSFIRPQNSTQSLAEFIIDPESQAFKTYVEGHKVLGNGSCPASVYVYLVVKAFAELVEKEDIKMTEGAFCIELLVMQSPLGLSSQRTISLGLESADHTPGRWSFRICSRDTTDTQRVANHASGTAYLKTAESPVTVPGDVQPCRPRIQDGEETSIEGSFIYNVFSTVVEYADYFRGMQKVSSRGNEVTGIISLDETSNALPQIGEDALCNPLMIDNFLQVAGLYINCLRNNKPGVVYVCTQIQEFQYYLVPEKQQVGPWNVVCHLVDTSEKAITYDITASHAQDQTPIATISGASFSRASAASLTKTLSKLRSGKLSHSIGNTACHVEDGDAKPTSHPTENGCVKDLERDDDSETVVEIEEQSVLEKPGSQAKRPQSSEKEKLCFTQLRELLHSVTDVPVDDMHHSSLLEDIGVDSLMTTEVLSEIEKSLNINITMSDFEKMKDLGCLCSYIESKDPQRFGAVVAPPEPVIKSNVMTSLQGSDPLFSPDDDKTADSDANSHNSTNGSDGAAMAKERNLTQPDTKIPSPKILECFEAARGDFIRIADATQLTGFTESVYPRQAELVVAYVLEAFKNLGCCLMQLKEGDSVSVPFVPQHTALMKQLHLILQCSSLIHCQESSSVRSATSISGPPSHDILLKLLDEFPQHASEHRLLGAMGPHLASFLSGKEDPIQTLFGDKANKDLLTDVYTNAPMFATGTRLLADFLSQLVAIKSLSKPVRILEIGGGVGGTTASIVELLEASGIPFTYTFTDISSSLVAAAKKRFTSHESMDFKVLDVEAEPQDSLLRSQDVIIATNVIHATKVLKESCVNIRKMLDKHGILCLLELTRNLYWFDLVFGLLDGWWRFADSRKHAIADAECWERNLKEAEFEHVVWTGDGSEEGDIVRLLVAFAPNETLEPESYANEQAQTTMETMLFKHVDRIPLYADVYYPKEIEKTKSKRPIGTSPFCKY